MKNKLLALIAIILNLTSCKSNIPNYNMISGMNNSYTIEIVYFDEKTSNELGEFPVSRDYSARLIHEIEKDNPKILIMKFFYDMPTENDTDFINALSMYDNIFTQATTILKPDESVSKETIEQFCLRDFYIENLENNETILLPYHEFINDFNGIGLVDMITNDNEYLDFPIVSKVQNMFFPSLALKICMNIANTEPVYKNGNIFLDDVIIEAPYGMYKIDLSEPKSLYKTHSFIDIINGTSESNFTGKIVIVFIEDPSVRQIKSEYNSLHNNAEIIADTINSILKELE